MEGPTNLSEFELGGKIFRINDTVRVLRDSGEMEDDWKFAGLMDGGKEVRLIKSSGEKDHSMKSAEIDKFLSWQE